MEGKEDPTCSDTSLPFSSSQVDGHFGIENSSHFSSGQHKFCPIDPVEIDINFENIREELRGIIDKEATVHCKNINEHGQEEEQVADTWSSGPEVQKVFSSNKHLVKKFYIAWCNTQQDAGLPQNPQDLRKYSDEVTREADKFCRGVVSRERILATLLFAAITARSALWEHFIKSFLKWRSSDESNSQILNDGILPFHTIEDIKVLFENQGHWDFYRSQFRFWPIELRHGDEIDWTRIEILSFLPLREKSYIDEGS